MTQKLKMAQLITLATVLGGPPPIELYRSRELTPEEKEMFRVRESELISKAQAKRKRRQERNLLNQ